jgi:hypothetical protein
LYSNLSNILKVSCVSILTIAIISCGGASTDTPTVTESKAPEPVVESKAPAPVVESKAPAPVVAEAVPITKYKDFIFSLDMESGAIANTMAGSTENQGTATFNYGGVNAMLAWVPSANFDPVGSVKGMFTAIQSSNSAASFVTVAGGELRVGFESGEFVLYTASESGASVGGGIIGSWSCADTNTSFTLFVSGKDSTNLQLRFKRLIDKFDCDGDSDTAIAPN